MRQAWQEGSEECEPRGQARPTIEGMGKGARKRCGNCQRLQTQVDTLQARLEALSAEFVKLREELATARKDSSTSSKPPSSDIVKAKPAQDANAGKRSIGGQPGHPKHDRQPFPAEHISRFFVHPLDACPCCGGPLRRNGDLAHVV